MIDREKVINGLKTIIADDWMLSMLRNADYYAIVCKDALALLEAQKPRVLTADEMEDAGRNGDPVYVETACGGRFWALAIPGEEPPKDKPFNYPGGVRFNALDADEDVHDGDFYGMTTLDGKAHCLAWRAWTDKPTDAQREATPWN